MTVLDPSQVDPAGLFHSSFKIDRHLKHAPAKVFNTFADKQKKQAWFVASDGPDWTTKAYDLDFRIGGREHGVWVGPDGIAHGNETVFLDIIDNALIACAYTMAMDGNIHSASLATMTFAARDGGTLFTYHEQGAYYGGSDGTAGRQAGWEQLLQALEQVLG